MGVMFYYDLISQPSRAIFMFMKKEGIKFDSKVFKLFEGEHKSDKEFAKVNPDQTVPVLVDDGTVYKESAAILGYLIEEYKKASWLGGDKTSRARVIEVTNWHHSGLRAPCVNLFLSSIGAATLKPDTKANITKAVERIASEYLMEKKGKTSKKFIGGGKISTADLLCYCELQQLSGVLEEEFYTKNSKVKQWMVNVEKELGAAHKEGSTSIVAWRTKFESDKKAASQQKKLADNGIMFYYDLISQPSRAIYMFMKKEGIKFDSTVFKLFEGEHKSDKEFAKVNPDQSVPVLVDDGIVYKESAAILGYLIEKCKKASWLGSDITSRARVIEVTNWHHSGLRKPCVNLFLSTIGAATLQPDTKANITKAVERIASEYLMEKKGKTSKKFIGGANISTADLLCYCELQQLSGILEEEFYTKNPKVKQWMENVEKELGVAHKEGSTSIAAWRTKFELDKKGSSQQKK